MVWITRAIPYLVTVFFPIVNVWEPKGRKVGNYCSIAKIRIVNQKVFGGCLCSNIVKKWNNICIRLQRRFTVIICIGREGKVWDRVVLVSIFIIC